MPADKLNNLAERSWPQIDEWQFRESTRSSFRIIFKEKCAHHVERRAKDKSGLIIEMKLRNETITLVVQMNIQSAIKNRKHLSSPSALVLTVESFAFVFPAN